MATRQKNTDGGFISFLIKIALLFLLVSAGFRAGSAAYVQDAATIIATPELCAITGLGQITPAGYCTLVANKSHSLITGNVQLWFPENKDSGMIEITDDSMIKATEQRSGRLRVAGEWGYVF